MAERGNPNWSKALPPLPVLLTEFGIQVERLRLTPTEYVGSVRLRCWCERNRNRVYVPEWLLEEWRLQVEAKFSGVARPRADCIRTNSERRSKETYVSPEDNPRYLRFGNVLDREPIHAFCNQCERQFVGVYRADERTDDVILRIRAEFEQHRCDANSSSAIARVPAQLVRSLTDETFAQVGHDGGDPLCAHAVVGIDSLLRRWPLGDRQQRGRTCLARSDSRSQTLFVRRFRCRWRAGCRHL
jgi:hypothetical protein